MDLRFCGVCSIEDFEFLRLKGVQYIGFDFRPLSINFIQLYKAQEILKANSDFKGYLVLTFDNDKDFVINEIFKTMSDILESSQIIIDFAGLENSNILKRVDVKYMLNYHRSLDLNQINLSSLNAIKITYDDMSTSYGEEVMAEIIKSIPSACIAIDCNWDSDLQASFMSYPNIKILSFQLNNLIQKEFRKLDHTLFDSFINYNTIFN